MQRSMRRSMRARTLLVDLAGAVNVKRLEGVVKQPLLRVVRAALLACTRTRHVATSVQAQRD